MIIYMVIPAYNEAKRIGDVLSALKKVKLPVVIVDDGSKDGTFLEASKYGYTVLRHKVNLGKGAALKTGCEAAFMLGAEAVVLMDADGQHRTEDLPKFVNAIDKEKYDLVFGSRNFNLNVPFVRFLGNKFASVLISLLFNIYVSDLLCGFRAFNESTYQKIKWISLGYGVETEMVVRASEHDLKYCEVPVEIIYYDKFKGVTIMDAFKILFHVLKWRISK